MNRWWRQRNRLRQDQSILLMIQQVCEILSGAESDRECEQGELQRGPAGESFSPCWSRLGNRMSGVPNHCGIRQYEASASKPEFISDFDWRAAIDAASIYEGAVGRRQIAQSKATVLMHHRRVAL